MDPGEPLTVDAGTLNNKELEALGVEMDARDLKEALEYLSNDTILADSLGRPIWQEFIKVKQEEWNKHFYRVDEWERKLYAGIF